jgi:hypothetical protein
MPIRFLVEVLWMGEFDALHISAPFDRGDGAFLDNPHLFSIRFYFRRIFSTSANP